MAVKNQAEDTRCKANQREATGGIDLTYAKFCSISGTGVSGDLFVNRPPPRRGWRGFLCYMRTAFLDYLGGAFIFRKSLWFR